MLALALLAPLARVDADLAQMAQRLRHPALERSMHVASDIGRPPVVLGSLLLMVVLEPAAAVPVARVALLALVPTNLAVEGLKRATQRVRPDGERDHENSSFPSSHAANAFALATAFALRWRRGTVAFYLGASLIAFSRIYLHRHYPSDVLVGVAIGMVCAWLADRWYRSRFERSATGAGTAAAPRATG
jgi:undecaprenyl-diphosphatase